MGILTFIMLMTQPLNLIAEDVVPKDLLPKVYTKAELVDKVYQYADSYHVKPQTMISIINCENKDWDINLQSRLKYKPGNHWGFPAGTQEKSFGLVQIHLPDNKVTLKQATNPDFSLDFMASNISKGRATMWTCYKKLA